MYQNPPPELSGRQLTSFCQALSDEDSFTLLCELTYSEAPAFIPTLCRTFGAAGPDITRVLHRLVQLGVAERRGRAFAATHWAVDALYFLESALSTLMIEGEDVAASEDASISTVTASSASNGYGAATFNGAWTGFVVNAGAEMSVLGSNDLTATVQETADEAEAIDIVPRDDPKSATRSHLYK